jgi:hypothetical protein
MTVRPTDLSTWFPRFTPRAPIVSTFPAYYLTDDSGNYVVTEGGTQISVSAPNVYSLPTFIKLAPLLITVSPIGGVARSVIIFIRNSSIAINAKRMISAVMFSFTPKKLG